MLDLGPNVRLQIHPSHRDAVRTMLGEGVGLSWGAPSESWDLFAVGRGGSIGVNYTEGALTDEQARLGAWLEILVPDAQAAADRLAALGFAPFPFVDHKHRYYAMPGGQVFRLASAG